MPQQEQDHTSATLTTAASTDRAVVVRFAGDSGDGMQLTGSQFTRTTAMAGHDLATLPSFPAEIRAPAGTPFGVSSFQIQFGADRVATPGDAPEVLVAMNPAALAVNLPDLAAAGTVILNSGGFSKRNLAKAGYAQDPRDDGTLDGFQVIELDIARLTKEAVKPFGLSQAEALRCKNLWALGLTYWMYGHDPAATLTWIDEKFAARDRLREANRAALLAGHAYGETAELGATLPRRAVAPRQRAPGLYRTVTGAEGLTWGLLAGSARADLPMVFASYPITPASNLLHLMADIECEGLRTLQAEDEIAAACAAIGASYSGALGVTASSGPGIALKTEALGLAVSAELPLVVVNCQRGGPSTGLPTKTEQSDLYQALYGRHGDAPLAVLAAATPGDCFEVAVEAVRLATRYMVPVMVLADGYLVNAAEPWRVPDVNGLAHFPVHFRTDDPEGFQPYQRDPATGARPWVRPGTPDLEHRIGGLEKAEGSGHIAYEPENHQRMTDARAAKVAGIARDIPAQTVAAGDGDGRLAVVGWGSTYGALNQAVHRARAQGSAVDHIHLRYLSPFPANLGELLGRYDHVLVPELNNGQLVNVLRARFGIDARSLGQVTGQPFKVGRIEDAITSILEATA
ncbi:2-oxoacid:acceptor oxidoreductase subunit alpha [Alkalilimnicola ehrlichii MLHE-1]|uniref:Pyruvate flavodoxin/ferredoxin oxidoreductase domain protein n=1 Tax=Alkalilimnicola ehrlichii (strain ATCC BAA-1101 / DSM 17681 / MLHE-1) TaxID=187272 RepID=Q0AAJ5_ALKEH|nr:2-oxoacid:acceptor oxidoreductase subunit alpha [Alkalilimnicola ehrlichii]ABI56142.1 pyruvate flavodoxin/ferredoxin oxidoreductase domain protein [Alkalilimnicola ehrlichii MLHE-1]